MGRRIYYYVGHFKDNPMKTYIVNLCNRAGRAVHTIEVRALNIHKANDVSQQEKNKWNDSIKRQYILPSGQYATIQSPDYADGRTQVRLKKTVSKNLYEKRKKSKCEQCGMVLIELKGVDERIGIEFHSEEEVRLCIIIFELSGQDWKAVNAKLCFERNRFFVPYKKNNKIIHFAQDEAVGGDAVISAHEFIVKNKASIRYHFSEKRG